MRRKLINPSLFKRTVSTVARPVGVNPMMSVQSSFHAKCGHGSKMKNSPLQCAGFAKQYLFLQPRSTGDKSPVYKATPDKSGCLRLGKPDSSGFAL